MSTTRSHALKIAMALWLVVAIALLWPRNGSNIRSPRGETETELKADSSGHEVVVGEATTRAKGSPSIHARAVAASRAPSSLTGTLRESNDEILARLRSGAPSPTLEDLSGPPWPPGYDDPAIMRDVGLWPESPEERIARLRTGELPPTLDYVQGPPGLPPLRQGTPKAEVLAAWGQPVRVIPAQILFRGEGLMASLERELGCPPETDRIEYLETWQYTPADDPHPKQWRFDGDLLTRRATSVESSLALEIEREIARARSP